MRGQRTYRITLVGTNMQPTTFDKSKFYWAANYTFEAPSYVVMSDQIDLPMCFNDAGVKVTRPWGAEK